MQHIDLSGSSNIIQLPKMEIILNPENKTPYKVEFCGYGEHNDEWPEMFLYVDGESWFKITSRSPVFITELSPREHRLEVVLYPHFLRDPVEWSRMFLLVTNLSTGKITYVQNEDPIKIT